MWPVRRSNPLRAILSIARSEGVAFLLGGGFAFFAAVVARDIGIELEVSDDLWIRLVGPIAEEVCKLGGVMVVVLLGVAPRKGLFHFPESAPPWWAFRIGSGIGALFSLAETLTSYPAGTWFLRTFTSLPGHVMFTAFAAMTLSTRLSAATRAAWLLAAILLHIFHNNVGPWISFAFLLSCALWFAVGRNRWPSADRWLRT